MKDARKHQQDRHADGAEQHLDPAGSHDPRAAQLQSMELLGQPIEPGSEATMVDPARAQSVEVRGAYDEAEADTAPFRAIFILDPGKLLTQDFFALRWTSNG